MDAPAAAAPRNSGALFGPASRAFALAAFGLGLFLYLGFLGRLPLQRGNEAMYAYPPIHMLESGDYLVPRYEGKDFLEKPPLAWWIIAASYRFLGISVVAERLPSALASVATILLIGCWTRRRSGGRAGALAALILMFSFQFLVFTLSYAADAFLTLAVTAAVIILDATFRRVRGSDAVGGAMCGSALALAFYFKGLAGVVIPAGAVAAGLLVDRARPVRPWRRAAWAAGALLILLLPWHGAMVHRLGAGFWRSFYWENQFLRGGTTLYMQPRGPFYYLGVLAWAIFPWSLFLPGALRRRRPSSAPLAWLLFALLFWSLLVMKREVYLMTLFPAAAVLVAESEGDAERAPSLWRRLPWVLSTTALAAILTLWVRASGVLAALGGSQTTLLVSVALVGAVLVFGLCAVAPTAGLTPFLAALALGFLFFGIRAFESRLSRFEPLPEWGARVREACGGGCDGFLYGINAYGIDFSSRLDWIWVADPPKEIPERMRHGRAFLVMWTDLEPTLARLSMTAQVLDRRPVFERHWATIPLHPAVLPLRSLSLVRLERMPAAQSGGAASAAGAPEESVRQPIAPSTTAPPAIE